MIINNQYYQKFKRIMSNVIERYQSEALVIQCGADWLAYDKLVAFNLTI